MTGKDDILLIGYGNPGRLDDGLGPALAEAIEAMSLPGVTVESDYQLSVEDAAEVAGHRLVIFADADSAGAEPFSLTRIAPAGKTTSFSTHSVRPEAVLALAGELFGAQPDAYVLAIRGYQFDEFGEQLSPQARKNLTAAVAFIADAIRQRHFEQVHARGGHCSADRQPCSEAKPCKTAST